jgi:LSD1 subclass zinc finger protein
MPPLYDLKESPAISVRDLAISVTRVQAEEATSTTQTVERIQLDWDAPEDASVECVAVFVRRPSDEAFTPQAAAILGSKDTNFGFRPLVETGEYCFKLLPLAQRARGAESVRCARVQAVDTVSVGDGPEIYGAPASGQSASLLVAAGGGAALLLAFVLAARRRRLR